jgi:hypothetical protein
MISSASLTSARTGLGHRRELIAAMGDALTFQMLSFTNRNCPGSERICRFQAPITYRSHPVIQTHTVSRNQDDTVFQVGHGTTVSPERAPHKSAGLLTTSSEDAQARRHQP